MCVRGICIYLEKPEVEIYRKLICIFCMIEMSGTMLGSMPEVAQQTEIPFITHSTLMQSAYSSMPLGHNASDTRTRNRYQKTRTRKLVPVFWYQFFVPNEIGSKISGLIFLYYCPPINLKATK